MRTPNKFWLVACWLRVSELPYWNTAKFKTLWRTKFAVLMARERGRIGSDAALGDMPKRLQAHSYDEMNEGPAR